MFGGKLIGQSSESFSVSKADNSRLDASNENLWHRKPGDIIWLKQRFKKVNIECADFEEVMNRYDRCGAFFYCDPPYVDVGNDYYDTTDEDNGGVFDHERFIETLLNLDDARWMVSYDHNIPSRLEDFHTISRTKTASISSELPEKTETLTMNYDPATTPGFKQANQSGLEQYE